MPKKTLKDWSRNDWTVEAEISPSLEHLKLGAILRIADAVEKTAANYDQLRRDKEYYERLAKSRYQEMERLKHSRAGYMAALTRLRNKVEKGLV